MDSCKDLAATLRASSGKVVLLDGAVGTELERRGVPAPAPLWSAAGLRSHPQVVQAIHEEYVRAGADIITANTFRAAHRTFAACGVAAEGPYLVHRAVALARAAQAKGVDGAARQCWVASSVGPVADCYDPHSTPPDEVLNVDLRRTLQWHNGAAPDVIWIETMNTVREALISATLAARTGRPVVVCFLLREDGHLLGGDALEAAVDAVMPAQPIAMGLNCMPPSGITQLLPRLRKCTDLPIAAYAHINNKTPLPGWSYTEFVTPQEYAAWARRWRDAGAGVIGGCCGTTPAHIAELAAVFR